MPDKLDRSLNDTDTGMVEIVALSLAKHLIMMTPEDCSTTIFTGSDMRRLAKAALQAIREPSFAMLTAGLDQDGIADSWRAMIGVALGERV